MKDNSKEKFNTSCVKLFEFIKMLYEGEVPFKTVIEHFSDGNYDGTSNTHVTLNKYLNAMKIFGIKVRKHEHKYSLLTPIYTINFEPEDLQCIDTLKKAGQMLPDGKVKSNFDSFIHALEIRYDDNTKDIESVIRTNHTLDLAFSHAETIDQIKTCEQYCQDKLKLEIIYFKGASRKEVNLICSPLEVTYIKKTLCLKVIGNNGTRVYEIPLEDIKSIKQLPDRASSMSIPTTVTFRIKNRLANSYKLREWEKLQNVEDDGSKIIVNKSEDLNNLLQRLMKYGTECELIAPKFLKEEMLLLINKTLSNYK